MKNTVDSTVKWLVACLFILAGPAVFNVGATHIVGGQLTYKYIGRHVTNTNVPYQIYEITLTFRRDCKYGDDEAKFDDPATIGVFTRGGEAPKWIADFQLNLNQPNGAYFDRQSGFLKIPFSSDRTLNEYILSDCGFIGERVCVHETNYKGRIALPYYPTRNDNGFRFVYQRCCRNFSLNNVQEPLETGSTYVLDVTQDVMKTNVDEIITRQNNTPQFKKWPDVYICLDKDLVFDHSAVDAEGDSLAYELYTPFTGGTRAFAKPEQNNKTPTPRVNSRLIQWVSFLSGKFHMR
jgi:hypothetical protein